MNDCPVTYIENNIFNIIGNKEIMLRFKKKTLVESN
jgi:hypothetical protein